MKLYKKEPVINIKLYRVVILAVFLTITGATSCAPMLKSIVPLEQKTLKLTGFNRQEIFIEAVRAARELGYRILKSDKLAGVFSAHRSFAGDWLESTDLDFQIVESDSAKISVILTVSSSLDGADVIKEFKEVYSRHVVILP